MRGNWLDPSETRAARRHKPVGATDAENEPARVGGKIDIEHKLTSRGHRAEITLAAMPAPCHFSRQNTFGTKAMPVKLRKFRRTRKTPSCNHSFDVLGAQKIS